MSIKIEMLDDLGEVTETIDIVHVCTAWREQCETAAQCEDCGDGAAPDKPVYVWTSGITGMTYSACGACLAVDDYARLVES
jgi:hypothetical protein